MQYIIAGLGNPGEEYEMSRHNTGRIMLECFRKKHDFPLWEISSNAKAVYSSSKIEKYFVELILPETFMNKSGFSISYAQKKHKIKLENIIVMYDDIDLPFGSVKIAFGRGSGGHKGLGSIIRAVKTKDFVRVLDNLKIDRSCLVAIQGQDENLYKSIRNIPKVNVILVNDLNAGDICRKQKMLFTKDAFLKILGGSENEKN